MNLIFVFSRSANQNFNQIIYKYNMKSVQFAIPYRADSGAALQVVYRLDSDDNGKVNVLPMNEVGCGEWRAALEFDDVDDVVYYGYEYVCDGVVLRSEWDAMPHSLRINSVNDCYVQNDMWIDSPPGYYMQTALFRMFSNSGNCEDDCCVNWYNRSVTLSVYIFGLDEGEQPAVAGDIAPLGAWNPAQALPLQCVAPNLWSVTFDAEDIWCGCIEFKIIARRDSGEVRWEKGDNRRITLSHLEYSVAHSFMLGELRFSQPSLRLAGTVIPLFSLRSERSWGIGDFGDLKAMVDWLAHTRQHVLQLLPVNDTTVYGGNEDSYPYNCISVFALNPIYADIESLPRLSAARMSYYNKQRAALNACETVNYAAVYSLKMSYLHELFDKIGEEMVASNAYRAFARAQKRWLRPYALYRFLLSRLRCDFSEWGEYSSYNENTYKLVVEKYNEAERELQFHTFVQYILFSQLSEAHSYANSKRVALKGDIPIGVAPNGVDVWCDPSQFNLSVSAGAPPDAFSANGQNWGFPTYNWQQMAADGYEWWRCRLQYMSNFFDAYRIDHILGFFRIWEIPRWAKSGLAGRFAPSLPLSADDIAAAGLVIDKWRLHAPFATAHDVKETFGDMADYVLDRYFVDCPDGSYTFKERYLASEVLLADLYSADSPLSYELKDELIRMYGDVLFFKDENGYTPRIDAFTTQAYDLLSDCGKAAYGRIYEEYFYNRHTMFWYNEGMRKLMPVLLSTPMTACGEDLGMIPACVPWVMRNLQILSLEIQRMPKEYGVPFARPASYPYLSVATPSTHDMSTLRAWWREDAAATQRFYNEELHYEGEAPENLTGVLATDIIRAHMDSSSLLALFAWQDLMAMDERLRRADYGAERINEPANRNHVWCYRMHITIEQLLDERGFNDFLRSMIIETKRDCGSVI